MIKRGDAFNARERARFMRPDAERWLKPQLPIQRKYSPDQPRDEQGRWSDGNAQVAEDNSAADDGMRLANVVRVCILSGVARTTGYLGRQYTAFYDCANGLSVKQSGWGHRLPGLILDPH